VVLQNVYFNQHGLVLFLGSIRSAVLALIRKEAACPSLLNPLVWRVPGADVLQKFGPINPNTLRGGIANHLSKSVWQVTVTGSGIEFGVKQDVKTAFNRFAVRSGNGTLPRYAEVASHSVTARPDDRRFVLGQKACGQEGSGLRSHSINNAVEPRATAFYRVSLAASTSKGRKLSGVEFLNPFDKCFFF